MGFGGDDEVRIDIGIDRLASRRDQETGGSERMGHPMHTLKPHRPSGIGRAGVDHRNAESLLPKFTPDEQQLTNGVGVVGTQKDIPRSSRSERPFRPYSRSDRGKAGDPIGHDDAPMRLDGRRRCNVSAPLGEQSLDGRLGSCAVNSIDSGCAGCMAPDRAIDAAVDVNQER
jgi:hypothetical protein